MRTALRRKECARSSGGECAQGTRGHARAVEQGKNAHGVQEGMRVRWSRGRVRTQ